MSCQCIECVGDQPEPTDAEIIMEQERRIAKLEQDNAILTATLQSKKTLLAACEEQLAALRQRIADAPVVSWRCVCNGGETYHFGFQEPTPSDWESCIPLISKEDLQK